MSTLHLTNKRVIINFTSDNCNKLPQDRSVLGSAAALSDKLPLFQRIPVFLNYNLHFHVSLRCFYHKHTGIELELKIVKVDDRRVPFHSTLELSASILGCE